MSDLNFDSNVTMDNVQNNITNIDNKMIYYIIFIIFILALFGLNIFGYLEIFTDSIVKIFKPLVRGLFTLIANLTSTVVGTTSKGGEKVIDKSGEAGKNIIKYSRDGAIASLDSIKKFKNNEVKTSNNDILISDNKNKNKNKDKDKDTDSPSPVSTSYSNNSYCYIGKVNDMRYCTKVSDSSKCMSNELFSSMEECIA